MPLFTSEYVFSDDYPTIEPSLKLDFANARALDPRITFTRASTATYVGANGLIKTAGVDEARFDHDPSTGESLGLLIEESRTNILPYSEDFSQSAWVTFGTASKSSNVATAPDGNFTADSITIPAASGVLDNILISVNTTYTFSAYIRGTPGTTIRILSNANSSGIVTNIVTVSEIWQRYSVTFTTNSGDNNTSIQFDSGGGNTFYVWGAQVEAGSFPTSYIPTNGPTSGSTVTRAVDNAFITGQNFSSWYNQDEGTIYVSQKLKSIDTVDRNSLVYLINGGSGSDIFYNVKNGDTNIFVFGDNGTNYSRWQENGDSTDTKAIWAYDVSGDDFKPYWNGIEGVNESNSSSPSATSHTQLEIGATVGAKYNGHIAQLTYYPQRLPNSQLVSLTR
jgi:hypothetical protein